MDTQPLQSERLRTWLLALGVFAVVIFFFSPAWSAFDLWSRVPEMGFQVEVRRGGSVLEQVAHPGAPITDSLHAAIQWRLVFPLIGKILNLPSTLLFSLAHVGCLLVLGFIITHLRRAHFSWADTTLATLTLGAASWFFTSTGWLGYYDSWLAFALLIVAFAENRRALWAACIWAPWVDERFALAAPLALFCRYLHVQPARSPDSPAPFHRRNEIVIPSLLIGGFLLVRLGLLPSHSNSGATVGGYFSGKNFLDAPLPRIALGIWDGLRSAWWFVLLAVLALRPQPSRALALALATLALLIAGLATAQDYSRSMTMLLPVALLGLLLAARHPSRSFPVALALAALAAVLLPAHHVMNDRVDPIYYLHHELAAFENPSRAAMPELYELRAIHAMEHNEFPSAENYLTLAIKLSPNPTSPARQRGILRASQQRWAEAAEDFALLAKNEPQNPDAWFMQAQAHFALGNRTAAQTDLARARSLAPPEWTSRPDVARFIAKINAP